MYCRKQPPSVTIEKPYSIPFGLPAHPSPCLTFLPRVDLPLYDVLGLTQNEKKKREREREKKKAISQKTARGVTRTRNEEREREH